MMYLPGIRIEKRYLPPFQSKAFVLHTLIAGLSGSGKSNAMECLIVGERGKEKQVDFYDSGRFENMLYAFPEADPLKVKLMREITNGMVRPGASPNEIIMVAGKSLMDYPVLPGNKDGQGVFLRAFREENLSLGDITYLLGQTQALQGFLSYIAFVLGTDEISFNALYDALRKPNIRSKIPPAMLGSINRYMTQWKNSGMFSRKVDAIDIEKSMMNKDVITSYSTTLLEPEEEAVAYTMIIKEIFMLKKKRKVPHRIRLNIKEIAGFFVNDGYELFRKYLFKIQREGRDLGIDIRCDTQRPGDLPPTYRTQFGYYYLMKANNKVAESMSEVQEIPREILLKIPHYDVGQAIMMTGQRWDAPVQFPPTPHLHKVPGMDVMAMLMEKYGSVRYDAEAILAQDNAKTLEDIEKDEAENNDKQKKTRKKNAFGIADEEVQDNEREQA